MVGQWFLMLLSNICLVNRQTFRGSNYVYEIGVHMSDTSSCEVYIVPNNMYKQRAALEMLGKE